ncbi:MAG: alpha/beta hydrolase [Desulfobacterales bacterium]
MDRSNDYPWLDLIDRRVTIGVFPPLIPGIVAETLQKKRQEGMAHKQKIKEIVNKEQKVECLRFLHEVSTEDGSALKMTQKTPLDRKPVASVILVHGLGQNRYSWSLSRRSMENYLVAKGFETYNVELRGHGLSRSDSGNYPERFQTYLKYDLPAFLQAIQKTSNPSQLFYMGHSLGGTIAYCLEARFQKKISGIISIGGPFHMAKGNFLLKNIARAGVAVEKLAPFHLPYPKAFYVDYIGALARPGLFLMDSPLYKIPLQIWYPGSIERDILKERITKGFDRTGMNVVRFMFKWGAEGKLRGLFGDTDYEKQIRRLQVPILFLVGDKDHAVPLASVQAAYDQAGSRDKTLKIFNKQSTSAHWGHIDMICGRNAPLYVWPYMLKWLRKRLAA